MKIGIISINLYTKWLNLACPLHSYAMQQFLLKNGYESQVIDYKPSYYDNYNMRHPADYYKAKYQQRMKQFPANPEKRADWFNAVALTCELGRDYGALYNERASRYDKFKNFIDTRLSVSEKGYNSASMEFEDPGYDCYMCVTDVIWKSEPLLERAFFLANKCMDNKIKIAYSASRGSSYTTTEKQKKQFFRYLGDFDAISVREPSLEEHIRSNSSLEATTVLDPVMLHDGNFYEEIAQDPEEKGYLFLYHVVQDAEDTIEQAVKYAKAHNLTIIESSDRPYPEGKLTKYEGIEHKWVYDIGIEQWLGYIKNAACVFTNSFHCCCLSILFGKEFFAGSRNGDKVDTVLATFGLENRRFDISTDILGNEPEATDYEKVHKILAEKQKESGDWLLEALRKAEAAPERCKDYITERRQLTYPLICNLCVPDENLTAKERAVRSPEIRTAVAGVNNGETVFEAPVPKFPGHRLLGWTLRCKVDKNSYSLTKDGGFAPWGQAKDSELRIFENGDTIPHMPVNGIASVIADAVWEKLVPTFSISFNSTLGCDKVTPLCDETKKELKTTKNNRYEYKENGYYKNGADYIIPDCPFRPDADKNEFIGWKLRFWSDLEWYWYLEDGTVAPEANITKSEKDRIRIFLPGEALPLLPEGAISNVIFCAHWISCDLSLAYHSGGLKESNASHRYDEQAGTIKITDKGSFEYLLNEKVSNQGTHCFADNGFIPEDERVEFIGWQLRIKDKKAWSWYLEDGSTVKLADYSPDTHGQKRIFLPGEEINGLNIPGKADMIAVAVWKNLKTDSISIAYHSGSMNADNVLCEYDTQLGTVKTTGAGAFEYALSRKISNDGSYAFDENRFKPQKENISFSHWTLRVKDEGVWKWYLEDGSLIDMNEYKVGVGTPVKAFRPGDTVDKLMIPEKANLVAVASWKKS